MSAAEQDEFQCFALGRDGGCMNQSGIDPTHLAALLIPMFLFGVVASIVLVIPYWFIYKKAGFSPCLAILMFVPLANIIVLYIVAFSEWKVVPVPPFGMTAPPQEPYRPQS